MMTIMDRNISYQINGLEKPQKISGFLKEKGYSRQNLVDLRKDEQAICLNGTYVHMNHMLAEGDVLTVWIREKENSGQIRPVKLPFAIVYEDEDLLVINKPAGMPVHPSRGNPENSLGNALAWYLKSRGFPLCSAVSTGWTGIPPGLLLWQNMRFLRRSSGRWCGQKPSRD